MLLQLRSSDVLALCFDMPAARFVFHCFFLSKKPNFHTVRFLFDNLFNVAEQYFRTAKVVDRTITAIPLKYIHIEMKLDFLCFTPTRTLGNIEFDKVHR